MDIGKFIVILLLYCAAPAHFYPSKPLNERSSELSWQAYILLDDQNQNKQQTNSDGMTRRRITAKSVFIAPNFKPESLPPCANGYTSDVMGRCVPIIKIDEDAHIEIILRRLEEKFGLDYDYQMEADTTPGPLHIDIPLKNQGGDEETDVAIVISPTKPLSVNLDKRDSIDNDDEKMQEIFLKKLAGTTTKEPDGTTTVTEPITTYYSEEITPGTEDLTSATQPLSTTKDFTTTATESHNTKRSTDNLEPEVVTTTEELPPTTDIPDTTTIQENDDTTMVPKIQEEINTYTPLQIKFPEYTTETPNLKSSFVKFPDVEDSYKTQIPSSIELNPSSRDVSSEDSFLMLPERSRKVIFRDKSQPEEANLDYSNGLRHLTATTTQRTLNRRNRDKHDGMFLLPPRWSRANFKKPLVLRFSRKYTYLDDSQFKNPDYYRAVPMDDYAYLFSKHRQSSNR